MLNVITLVGRLTRDPELKKSQNDNPFANFTLAVDNGKKSDGEKDTLFIDCTAFGKQADAVAKFVRKGHLLGISGRLLSRKYTNKDGVNVTAFSVEVNRVELMEPKQTNTDSSVQGAPVTAEPAPIADKGNLNEIDVEEEGLPF